MVQSENVPFLATSASFAEGHAKPGGGSPLQRPYLRSMARDGTEPGFCVTAFSVQVFPSAQPAENAWLHYYR